MATTALFASAAAVAPALGRGDRGSRAGRDAFARNASPRFARRGSRDAVALASSGGDERRGLRGAMSHSGFVPSFGTSHGVSRDVRARMGGRVDPKDAWWQKEAPENVKDVDSMDAFLRELRDAGDKLVVVDFYARWCGACRALYPKLCKLAAENPDAVFLKVEFDDNKDMCRSMGVKVLPFFHMYRGKDGKVASFSASVSKVHRLRDALAEHGGNAGANGAGSESGKESEKREPAPTR